MVLLLFWFFIQVLLLFGFLSLQYFFLNGLAFVCIFLSRSCFCLVFNPHLSFFFVCFRSWPNYTHRPTLDPPLVLCERAGCTSCGGLASDERLQSTFVQHSGPWKKEGAELLKQEMESIWKNTYQPKVDAAAKEMAGKLSEEELKTQLGVLETQWREHLEDQRKEIAKKVDSSRIKAFKKCGKCQLVRYCSVACQKDDWRAHSAYCVEEKKPQ